MVLAQAHKQSMSQANSIEIAQAAQNWKVRCDHDVYMSECRQRDLWQVKKRKQEKVHVITAFPAEARLRH